MRHVLAVILVTVLVVAGAWWIEHLAGAVTVQVSSYTIQAPISVAVVAIMLFSGAIYGFYRLLGALFGVRHAARRFGMRGSRRRGEQAVTQTLVALAAREGQTAKQMVLRARQYLGDTPQVLLLSASAGNMAGDAALASEAFEKLAAHRDGAFLGLRGLLSQAVAREDWVRANELARQAEKKQPGGGWLRPDRTAPPRPGDWQEAVLLTRDAAPHAALAAAAADAEADPVQALKLAKDAFKRDSGLPAAALAYASRLRQSNREKAAQDILRKAWARTPNPDLAAMALAPAPDRAARLKTAHMLVRDAAENPESHLLLARLSLEAGLLTDARRHVEAAERGGLRQRRVYALEAELAEAEGNDEQHVERQHAALKRAAEADPDPAWTCGACGVTHGNWLPACPNCHAVGRIRWTTPQGEVLAA